MSDHHFTPFRFREINDSILVTNEVGNYKIIDKETFNEIISNSSIPKYHQPLNNLSTCIENKQDWKLASLKYNVSNRYKHSSESLSYLIVVPTLRCNLSCGYCQVSRAPINAKNFDWTNEHLSLFERFIQNLSSNKLKLEFQGGEPTLRPDLIDKIINISLNKFSDVEIVICTNLSNISPEVEKIIERDNVYLSTSVDGPQDIMTINRTGSDEETKQFFKNLKYITDKYGSNKVSALPTITDSLIDKPKELIDFYIDLGFEGIFLRPVNYVGFARKKYSDLTKQHERWKKFYTNALTYLVELNKDIYFEEFYLSLMLKSIFTSRENGYVDFRSPNLYASDYCVIDYDGTLYPTDEARMLSRTHYADMSIGSLSEGFDIDKIRKINHESINQTNPDCIHCSYMPYCGIDLIDDLSRYGRIDKPKHETWFCNKQLTLFDIIFSKIESRDKAWMDMFSKWIFRTQVPVNYDGIFYD